MRIAQSDVILDLLQSAAKVETEIETHADEVALRLDEWFEPLLGGGEEEPDKPDFGGMLLALKDALGDSREKLTVAEENNINFVKQAIELRDERQELTDGLYEDLTSMRRTVEELYKGKVKGQGGSSAFVVAGIQGPTFQKPARLLRQIDLAMAHLSQPGLVLPASRFGATQLDPQDLVGTLQPRAQRLHEVQAELRRLGSALNASRKEKNRALERHKSHFSWISQGAEAFFRLAGESELADRIRPATRRTRRKGASSDADSAPAGDAQDGDSQGRDSPTEDNTQTDGSVAAGAGDSGSGSSSADEPRSSEPATVPATQASSGNG